MQIKMSNLNYNFDNNGNTTSINISFTGNEGTNFISATMVVTPDDLPQGVDTLDDLNRKQVQELGREKLAKYTALTTATPTQGSNTTGTTKQWNISTILFLAISTT